MNGIILGIHLLTAHSVQGYETATPGFYVRHESGLTAGAYRNSIGRPSFYVGHTIESGRWAITLGAVTGYQRRCKVDHWIDDMGEHWNPLCSGHTGGKVTALVVPSVKVGDARLSLVAFKRPAVHLSWEF